MATIRDNSITTTKILDGAVNTVKLADNAVTTNKILDANITEAKIANNAVTNVKMADGAIGTDELQDNAVTYNKIQNVSAAGRLLGSSSTSTSVQEITLGSGLILNGNELTTTGSGETVSVSNGGTGTTSLANHGILIGSGTDAVTVTGTGSVGQVLQSGGPESDPAYSNAAYPVDAGMPGNILRSDGTNFVSTAVNTLQETLANSIGTNDQSGLMMGLGQTLTPNRSGIVLIIISGNISLGGSNGAKVQIMYGSGISPSYGDGIKGTSAGSMIEAMNAGLFTTGRYPFTVNSVITGLSVGSEYWFDLCLAAISGGTAYISNLSVSIVEL